MKIIWLSIIAIFSILLIKEIKGDTYHYRVLRKICPSGTYHDPIRDKCRRVPGGGEVVKFNLDAKCSKGFTGLLAYDKKSRYYFVCKSDAVLTCACSPQEIFNRVRLRCEGKNEKGGRAIIREKFTDEVVDNIMEKYKCTMMNGHYQNGACWLPTTEQYSISNSQRSSEEKNPSQLRNLLNYLKVLQNLMKSSEESWEARTYSIPTTTEREFSVEYHDPPTTTRERYETVTSRTLPPSTSRSIPKRPQKAPEVELQDWKRLWGITETTEESVRYFASDVKSEAVVKENENSERSFDSESSKKSTTEEPLGSSTTENIEESTLKLSSDDFKKNAQRSFEKVSSTTLGYEESTIKLSSDDFKKTTENSEISSTTLKSDESTLKLTTEVLKKTTQEDPKITSTTSNFEESTMKFDKTSTIKNFEESTLKSNLKTTTEEIEDFGGMTQKSLDDDDAMKTSTSLPESPVQSKQAAKPTAHRKVKPGHKKKETTGDTDFDEVNSQEEYMYEYFYEDDPTVVLWTKEVDKKNPSKSKIDEIVVTEDSEGITSRSMDEDDERITVRTINEDEEQLKISSESTTSLVTSTESLMNSKILETTTLMTTESSLKEKLGDVTTEKSLQKSKDDILTTTEEELVKFTTESLVEAPEKTTSFTTFEERIIEDESATTTENNLKIDLETTTISDEDEVMRHFDITTLEPKKIETTTAIEDMMRHEDVTAEDLNKSTTSEDLTKLNDETTKATTLEPRMVPEELNMMSLPTTPTNLINFERNMKDAESTTTLEPLTTEKILLETTDGIIKELETTSELIVELETTTYLPEDEQTVAAMKITSPQYPFSTTSTVNPLYWQDPAKKDEIEYFYEYEDYEVDENGKPIVKNESHDGKKSVKQRRENSFEYYIESRSASREHKKLESDMYAYYN